MARRRLNKLKTLWCKFVQNKKIKEAEIIKKMESYEKITRKREFNNGEIVYSNKMYRKLYFSFRHGTEKFNAKGIKKHLRSYTRKDRLVFSEDDIDLVLEVLEKLWNEDNYRKARAHNLKITKSEKGDKDVEFDSGSGSDSDSDEVEDDISNDCSDGSCGSLNSNSGEETPITQPRKRRKLHVLELEEDNRDDGNHYRNYDSRSFQQNPNSFFKLRSQDSLEDPNLFEAFKDQSKSPEEQFETFLWQKFPGLADVLN